MMKPEYRLKTPKGIEKNLIGTYSKIERGVVDTYKKIEKKFVDAFLEKTDEPVQNSSDDANRP